MSKPNKFKLKNHVEPKAKRISNVLGHKYGLDLAILDKALKGDQNALQLIGEAGRQGALTQELMPMLTEAYLSAIKGTEEYNKGISAILKQGASSAIAIDKSAGQASLANQKYGNQRKEFIAEYSEANKAENVRHQYALNYIQLKAYIDQYMFKVDNDAKLNEQTYRPEIKQVAEDDRYQLAASKHLLQTGENARLDLMPRREYIPTEQSGGQAISFKEKLKGLASALGFKA